MNAHRARWAPAKPTPRLRFTPVFPPPPIHQIVSHLRTYTQPDFQRFIIRIVFTVPVFAVTSFFSLLFGKAAVYFEAVRGW